MVKIYKIINADSLNIQFECEAYRALSFLIVAPNTQKL